MPISRKHRESVKAVDMVGRIIASGYSSFMRVSRTWYISVSAVELDAGNKVSIPGFGTFGTKYRAQRQGRNPATGATITIAGKTYPFFKAGKGLKDRVAD